MQNVTDMRKNVMSELPVLPLLFVNMAVTCIRSVQWMHGLDII